MISASEAKEAGISQAINNANEQVKGWSQMALDCLKVYIRNHNQFQCEDFRVYAETVLGLPTPPHNRAYGAVMLEAKKKNLIKSIGLRPTTNPKAHQANATVWQSNYA